MRRRILLLVVGMTSLVVLAFAIPLAILIRNNAYDDGIAGLRSEAGDIAQFLREDNTAKTSAEITAHLHLLSADRRASVQLPGGYILGALPPGGLTALPSPPPQRYGPTGSTSPSASASSATSSTSSSTGGYPSGYPGRGGLGGPGSDPTRQLDTQTYADGRLTQQRVPLPATYGQPVDLSDTSTYTVRVYASDSTLRSGQTAPLLLLVGVALFLLVVGVVAGEILTRRIIRPLVDTAGTAQRLSSGDTTARAPTDGPREVADVGLALNRLADRIDQLIAEERETVADLSHRLRTPMTALRLEAEALQDAADAERIGGHVSTLERMLTAVIRAARRPQREGRMPSCDATAVVGERVEFWSALAEDQGRTVTVALPAEPLPVRAGAEDLAAAVDALLENVIAHTPEGVSFAVALAPTDLGASFTIADDGPGLPVDAEIRGRSDRGSTGLGLDIARRCAEASGGGMTLGSAPSGGALVTLDLRTV